MDPPKRWRMMKMVNLEFNKEVQRPVIGFQFFAIMGLWHSELMYNSPYGREIASPSTGHKGIRYERSPGD